MEFDTYVGPLDLVVVFTFTALPKNPYLDFRDLLLKEREGRGYMRREGRRGRKRIGRKGRGLLLKDGVRRGRKNEELRKRREEWEGRENERSGQAFPSAVDRALDLRLEVAGSNPSRAALSSATLDMLFTHIVQRASGVTTLCHGAI